MNPKKKSRRCRASISIQALDLAISRFIHSLGCRTLRYLYFKFSKAKLFHFLKRNLKEFYGHHVQYRLEFKEGGGGSSVGHFYCLILSGNYAPIGIFRRVVELKKTEEYEFKKQAHRGRYSTTKKIIYL
jgi:hypothetical protein